MLRSLSSVVTRRRCLHAFSALRLPLLVVPIDAMDFGTGRNMVTGFNLRLMPGLGFLPARSTATRSSDVTVLADSLSLRRTAAGVFRGRDWFHMRRVLTDPIPAQVVDYQALRNGTPSKDFPDDSVGVGRFPVPLVAAVPQTRSRRPWPTFQRTANIDKAQEMFWGSYQNDMGRRHAEGIPTSGGDVFISPQGTSKAVLHGSPLGEGCRPSVRMVVDNGSSIGSDSPRPFDAIHMATLTDFGGGYHRHRH